MNSRLNNYIEKKNILGKEQVGFRAGCSTLDHLFTLHSIIEIILFKKSRLYCAFLDYEKAFDKIERAFLWQKLINCKVKGKILNVIKNLYANAKSSVKVGNEVSDLFQSSTGVRQGENLSPLLFALFLNDLKTTLNNCMEKLESVSDMSKDLDLTDGEVNLIVKMFVLLYADDTAVFAESPESLQIGLDCVKAYCDKWCLKLNASKCKVIIFSSGLIRKHPDLFIGNAKLEVVPNFGYLGLKLNYNNRFNVAQKDLTQRASKALFSLLKKAHHLSLPLDIVIDLFDKTVLPVLTYGCEVWGPSQKEFSTKLQLKFYKLLLNLRPSTQSMMVYGEVNRLPVEIHIKCRVLNYWSRLINPLFHDKISSTVYRLLFKLHNAGLFDSSYISFIRNTLNELGMSDLWLNQTNINTSSNVFKNKVKRALEDQFLQSWYHSIDNDSICCNYRMFKTVFSSEKYMRTLPTNLAVRMARFRTTNNNLPVNILRYQNVPRNQRLCVKCNMNDIGDEFHYLFRCPFFKKKRQDCLPKYFLKKCNAIKFKELFEISKKKMLKLAYFIRFIQDNIK